MCMEVVSRLQREVDSHEDDLYGIEGKLQTITSNKQSQ